MFKENTTPLILERPKGNLNIHIFASIQRFFEQIYLFKQMFKPIYYLPI